MNFNESIKEISHVKLFHEGTGKSYEQHSDQPDQRADDTSRERHGEISTEDNKLLEDK